MSRTYGASITATPPPASTRRMPPTNPRRSGTCASTLCAWNTSAAWPSAARRAPGAAPQARQLVTLVDSGAAPAGAPVSTIGRAPALEEFAVPGDRAVEPAVEVEARPPVEPPPRLLRRQVLVPDLVARLAPHHRLQ